MKKSYKSKIKSNREAQDKIAQVVLNDDTVTEALSNVNKLIIAETPTLSDITPEQNEVLESNFESAVEKVSNVILENNAQIIQKISNLTQIVEQAQKSSNNQLEILQKKHDSEKKQYQQKLSETGEKLNKLEESLVKKEKELKDVRLKIETEKKKVHDTLSYKLGYALIHSTKSFSNFLALPKDLYELRKLAKSRQVALSQKKSPTKPSKPFPKVDGHFKKQYNLKFISILDEISHTSFDSEFKLFPLNKASYQEQIQGSTSLGLLLESCWKGNFGAWEYAFTSPNLQHANAKALLAAIDTAKARNFPVIFWNKEDPMHYEKFLPISAKCDVVFTTDSNKVIDYQRDIPNVKVEAMLFAANINICNPANRFRTEHENICFAGSYYGEGHDDRKKQMDALLPTIIKFKGAIYDRMSQLENKRYAYPKKYQKFIRPAVPFREIVDVYKQFKIFLNVNTITDSPTMMSRRVYELLACGTPVISTPSLALEKQFPGIVQVASNAKEANAIAKRLLENEWEWLRISHLGYREVMLKHTYEHRAIQIANILGNDIQKNDALASIVMASNRPHYIDRIVENICQQTYSTMEAVIIAQNYSDQQLQDLENKIKSSGKKLENLHIIRNDSEDTLGKRLNQGVALSKGEYVAKFDDDDFYFPNYLQDMLIPFKFGNGEYGVVGKKEIFVYLENQDKTYLRFKSHRQCTTDFVAGPTLIFPKEVLTKIKFADVNRGEDSNILEQIKKLGLKVYATDSFNFVQFRSSNAKAHTWQVEDEFFTEKGTFVGTGLAENIVKL